VGLFPHERSLVERNQGKPFALLGVNIDNSPSRVLSLQDAGKITWRSFSGDVGKAVNAYGVSAIPTVVIIDHKGVVQKAGVGVPDAEELDKLLDKLVAAAEVGK
jgi:hypothetical protein